MVLSIAGNIYEGGSIRKGRFKGVRKSASHLSGVSRMDDMETGCMEEEDGDTIASHSIENLLKKDGEKVFVMMMTMSMMKKYWATGLKMMIHLIP